MMSVGGKPTVRPPRGRSSRLPAVVASCPQPPRRPWPGQPSAAACQWRRRRGPGPRTGARRCRSPRPRPLPWPRPAAKPPAQALRSSSAEEPPPPWKKNAPRRRKAASAQVRPERARLVPQGRQGLSRHYGSAEFQLPKAQPQGLGRRTQPAPHQTRRHRGQPRERQGRQRHPGDRAT